MNIITFKVICRCCTHEYTVNKLDKKSFGEQFGLCGICYWLYDEKIQDDDTVSKKNGLSVDQYRKMLNKYKRVNWLSDGYRPVSILDPDDLPLAYHSDYHGHQGKWGYIDKSGKEIIKPRYVYAFGFDTGTAMVCNGEWTKDKKWDNEYNTGHYWTEYEKWGVINKAGEEIIPCIYDELACLTDNYNGAAPIYAPMKYIENPDKEYVASKVAIFDNDGKMILDFIYSDFDYIIEYDQLIVYINGTKWDNNALCGVYDLKLKEEIIKPTHSFIEIVDRNLFLISKDSENGFNAKLINGKEELLSELNFFSIYIHNRKKGIYKAELMDRKTKFKFRIENCKLVKV